ncbi:MAG: mannitol-1-phosphate 5-dehydrogenase [Armatimonadota bacterium]|jgi:mannitol-1-phosphate 5-dehydrogenase
MKLAQIGAGNIGRSFIGQLFSRAGYEVVFIDIDDALVAALNERRSYTVEIRDETPETLLIENVRAVNGKDVARAAEELATADIAATAVGPEALPHVCPMLARALVRRRELGGGPLDVVICENMRNAAAFMREALAGHLPPDFPLGDAVGLIETSIGKMVPIMTPEQRGDDPLLVFAEAYNTLIVDGTAFTCGVPDVPGIDPKTNMKAWVDQKLFVHNLGHALLAYLGFLLIPEVRFVWEAVGDPKVGTATREGMWESGRALMAEYPDELDEETEAEQIEGLLRRFANRALGDTIYRVGRDLQRKLAPDDRVIGALRLDGRHGVEAPMTTLGAAAGMLFRATDEDGRMYPRDAEFVEAIYSHGPEHVLRTVCRLDPARESDRPIAEAVLAAHARIVADPHGFL